jgi:hypothetical protein
MSKLDETLEQPASNNTQIRLYKRERTYEGDPDANTLAAASASHARRLHCQVIGQYDHVQEAESSLSQNKATNAVTMSPTGDIAPVLTRKRKKR